MNLRKLMILTSVFEIIVGLTLIAIPLTAAELLFAAVPSDALLVLGRFTGIALLCVGLACMQGKDTDVFKLNPVSVRAMFVYNLLAGIYFLIIKFTGVNSGVLLLPASVIHILIAVCFIYFIKKENVNLSGN